MLEKTIKKEILYQGRIITLELQDVELENGIRSQREIIRHRGAAVVLVQLPDGRFLFVRQFRKPVEEHLIEIVAGTLEPGENHENAARRELKEESGYEAKSLTYLGEIHPSPGYVEERMHTYFAVTGDRQIEQDTDHDENLEILTFTRDEVRQRIRDGSITDAKTLAAWAMFEAREKPGTP